MLYLILIDCNINFDLIQPRRMKETTLDRKMKDETKARMKEHSCIEGQVSPIHFLENKICK